MVCLKIGLLRIGEIIFMVFLCPHPRHPRPRSSVRLPGSGRNEDASSGGGCRRDHGMVTERRKKSRLPKPISNRCMFFTHCAKEQPSTARDGGTSMLVGEHPGEILHAHPLCPAA